MKIEDIMFEPEREFCLRLLEHQISRKDIEDAANCIDDNPIEYYHKPLSYIEFLDRLKKLMEPLPQPVKEELEITRQKRLSQLSALAM